MLVDQSQDAMLLMSTPSSSFKGQPDIRTYGLVWLGRRIKLRESMFEGCERKGRELEVAIVHACLVTSSGPGPSPESPQSWPPREFV